MTNNENESPIPLPTWTGFNLSLQKPGTNIVREEFYIITDDELSALLVAVDQFRRGILTESDYIFAFGDTGDLQRISGSCKISLDNVRGIRTIVISDFVPPLGYERERLQAVSGRTTPKQEE